MRYLLLLFLASLPAGAQTLGAFQCKANADAPLLRSGGLAELLGEIRLDCTGDTGRGAFLTDIDVFLPSNYSGPIRNGRAEALLFVGDPSIPVMGETVYQATVPEPQSLRFAGVRLPSPGASNLRLRIVNLRVAAVDPSGSASPYISVSLSSSSGFPIDSPSLVAGLRVTGLRFQRLAAAVRFDEAFPAAFRKRNVATTLADPEALAPQSVYGRDYATETGFYAPAIANAGLATQGTRLMATFANVPAGTAVRVSYGQAAGSSSSVQARLVNSVPDADGMVLLPVSNGVAQAVWEVYASDSAALETLQFNVSTTATALGVTGRFVPDSRQEVADDASAVPRFLDRSESPTDPCGVSCLQLPSSIAITYTQGDPAPAPFSLPIRSSGAVLPWRAVATTAAAPPGGVEPPDGSWLALSPSSGATPAALTVTTDPSALAPGVYAARVTVSSGRQQQFVTVLLTVRRNPTAAAAPLCQVGRTGFFPLRNTGVTERLEEVVLTCDGTGAPVLTDLRLELDTTITSRPNDVLLLLNDPAPAAQALGVNVFRAARLGSTAVSFRDIPLPAAGATLRIVNLFVDASRTRPFLTDGTGLIKGRLRASVVNIRSLDRSFGQTEVPYSFGTEQTPSGWTLRFAEIQSMAFRPRTASGLSPQNIPGSFYNAETGFYNPGLANNGGIDMGLATQGTRLMARFNGVPPGVTLSVAVNETGATQGNPRAQLVRTDANGAGAYQAVNGPFAPVALTNGSGIAVWEVLRSDWLNVETLQFTLQVTGAYVPAPEGLLAPLSLTDAADATAPLPRFVTAPAVRPPCASFPCLRLPSSIPLTSLAPTANVLVGADAGPVPFLVAAPTVPWLRVTPAAGTTPGSFTVTGVPDGLAAGSYATTLLVNGAPLPVTFNVADPGAPALLLPVERTDITAETGSGSLLADIAVEGTPNLQYEVTSDAPWLQVTGGFIVPFSTRLRIDRSLPPGVYEAHLTFTSAATPAVTALIRVAILARPSVESIRGTITSASGLPMPGVQVELSGSSSRTTNTGADGVYAFDGLYSGGEYRVTPSSGATQFSPGSRAFLSIPAVQTADFKAVRGHAPFLQITPLPFTLRATDWDGAGSLRRVYFLINTSPAIAPCHGYYDRPSNAFYLYNDSLTAVLGPLSPGSSAVIQNAQCELQGNASTTTLVSDAELEVNFGLVRKGPLTAGAQKVYFLAQDADGNDTGWVYASSLNPAGGGSPVVLSAVRPGAPAHPEGVQFTVSDSDGVSDLTRVYFLINATPNVPANTCHGFYDFALQAFYLYDDSLIRLEGPLAPGSGGLLGNSQCVIEGHASTANVSGQITISLARLGQARLRAEKLFLLAADRTNRNSGWVDTGLAYSAGTNAPPTVSPLDAVILSASKRKIGAWLGDPDSTADIARVYFLIHPTPAISTNSCHGFYDLRAHALYLYNDGLTALTGPITAGSTAVIENSQCRLQDLAATTFLPIVYQSPFDFTVTRKGASAATDTNAYFWAVDLAGNGTGWVPVSRWTVNNPPNVTHTLPGTLYGPTQTFFLVANDPDGAANIQRLYFLINPVPSVPQNSCHGFYDQSTNGIYLYNDALTVLLGPLTPGVPGVLRNSQCTVNGAATSVTGVDQELWFRLNVTGTGAISAAPQNVYLWAVDRENNGTGWVRTASWENRAPNAKPLILPSITAIASGSPASVTFVASDQNGYADIDRLYFQVGSSSAPQANGCHGFYDRASNAIYLYNDALTALTPSLQNSQCAIDPASLRVITAPEGIQLSVTVTMSLQGAFASVQQSIWTWAVDSENAGTGWIPFGQWLVNANRPPVLLSTSTTPRGGLTDFLLFLQDLDGWLNIGRVYFLIADSPVIAANSCHGFYDRISGEYRLYNDALTALLPTSVNANSQCAILPQGRPFFSVSDTIGGAALTASLRGAYLGTAKNLYVWVVDQQGNGTGWVQAASIR